MAQTSTKRKRSDSAPRTAQNKLDRTVGCIPSDFARSSAADWIPPCSVIPENVALGCLKSEWKRHLPTSPAWHEHRSRRPVLIADLHDFEIYVSGEVKARSFELIGLQHLEVPRSKKLLLDGFLNIGAERHYVEGVAIHDYSIEGYGDKEDPTVVTYAQSVFAAKDSTYDIWYRLNKPTKWYEQHHAPFLWVAQLAKHVLDFMEEQPRGSVCLEDFRWSFQQWLATRFPNHAAFRVWLRAVTEQKDFRVCVNAYIEFMYQQAYNLPNSKALLAHSLWADCMAGGRSRVDMQEQVEKYTLATPDVYECFKHMYFGEVIRPLSPSKYVKLQQQHRMAKMGFQTHQRVSAESERVCRPYGSSHVKVGDVVAISPKNEDKKIWRNADWEWFLHVQDVQQKDVGAQRLMGMWLYRPCETTIFAAKYKYENELFYSDHCNCDDGDLLSTDANGRYDIEWAPAFIPSKAFFVRQTHVTQDSSFVTYSEKHKICACKKQEVPSYDCGDTVYITKHLGTRRVLEPVIIHQKNERTAEYTVRRLARLGRDLAEQLKDIRHGDLVATNELVLTDAYEKVTASQIERRCHVRFVTKDDIINSRISFPYNLNGEGDFWYVSMGLLVGDEQTRLMYLARPPRYSKQGQDLDLGSAVKKLCGLSLFGGGGSFDRGIEEGGGVEVQYVVEWDAAAMHTQRANARNPKEQRLWCGSVDDHLREALEGCTNELVPDIGRINIIIAGSPCPGFSTLQQNITSPASIKNASHITTLCSNVELYRPEYAILENVVSMANTRKGFETQNVLSHLVACFVAMGYQVNHYIVDAWSHGSIQQRSRIIMTIAAPGLALIEQLSHTHSLLAEDTAAKSLGRLPNGQRFGAREYHPTPFSFIPAGVATSDLPNIGNGNVQTCVSHPNHRVSHRPGRKEKALLRYIPQDPPGYGYAEAHRLGLIPSSLQIAGKESGGAFRRIKESGLVPTITTNLTIRDSRNGAATHWSQDRPITILEARRAQGLPDHEPIIGNLAAQYRIVGNGVDRHVAFAVGLSVRNALLKNVKQGGTSSEVETRDMLVDIEGDEDRFSEAAAMPSSCQSEIDSNTPDILGLDGSLDVRNDESMPRPANNSSLLSRMSTTVANSIKGLVYRSKHYPTPTMATPAPSKGSHDEIPEDVDRGSVRHDDRQASASREPRLVDAKERHVGREGLEDAAKDGEVPRKRRRVGTKSRYTRHSGLQVTFTPKQWNQKPEREHRISD